MTAGTVVTGAWPQHREACDRSKQIKQNIHGKGNSRKKAGICNNNRNNQYIMNERTETDGRTFNDFLVRGRKRKMGVEANQRVERGKKRWEGKK